MTGRIPNRSEDTVRSDFKDYVNQWITAGTEDHTLYTGEEMYLFQSMAIKLQEVNVMLTKAEAKLAKRLLEAMAIRDMQVALYKHENLKSPSVLSEVDCMSLYVDIFYMYLRPGTYSV